MRIAFVFVMAAAGCAASRGPVAECSCEQEVADAKADQTERLQTVEEEKEELVSRNAELEATKAALEAEVADLRAQIAALERFPDHAAVAKELDALKAEQKRLEQAKDDLDAKMPAVEEERKKLLEEKAALEAELRALERP